jgi:ELWxxDGT repeat protein
MSKSAGLATLFLFLPLLYLSAQPGAHIAKDLVYGPEGIFDADGTGIKATVDSLAIFLATTESGFEAVCRSDGTSIGTYTLFSAFLASNTVVQDFIVSQGLCWFILNQVDQSAGALYSTDGTLLGTKIRYLQSNGNLGLLRTYNNDLLFTTNRMGLPGNKLLRLNPTNGMITVIGDFPWTSGVMDLAVNGNTIYAIAPPDSTSRWLMKSDNGAAGSLAKVAQINTGSEFNQYMFMTPVGNRVFFFWQRGNEPYRLWVSDGTGPGTIGLKAFDPPFFEDLRTDKGIAALNNQLVFRAASSDDNLGEELYVSDGTLAGTQVLRDIQTGSAGSKPKNLLTYKGALWFTALDDNYNSQLWTTNATPTGTTQPLASANFGFMLDPAVFSGSLAFSAYRNADGAELFGTDGTPANTQVLTDESPAGTGDFAPADLAAAGNKLYFTAVRPETGRELWVYQPGQATSVADAAGAPFQIKLYPNPGTDVLQIETEQLCSIRVFSADGRLVYAHGMGSKLAVETRDWPIGVYEVQIGLEGKWYGVRWVKV